MNKLMIGENTIIWRIIMSNREDKIARLKEYIKNEKKYWYKWATQDGSSECSYYMDTLLHELNGVLKELEEDNE